MNILVERTEVIFVNKTIFDATTRTYYYNRTVKAIDIEFKFFQEIDEDSTVS